MAALRIHSSIAPFERSCAALLSFAALLFGFALASAPTALGQGDVLDDEPAPAEAEALLAVKAGPGSSPEPEPAGVATELRGVWIPNSHTSFFDSRETVTAHVQLLAEAGINVLFPVVWSKGLTLFDSEVAEAVTGHRSDPRYGDRDPLAEVLFEAHRHGLEVVPWFEYGFAAGHVTYPGQALRRRPEWAAIGGDGAPVVKNGFEWMNALDPEVQAFMTALIVEVAERYDIDGVQGDDRLPALPAEAGYDAKTIARYRAEHHADPPADFHDDAWTRWRAGLLTDYLGELRRSVKAVSSELAFSMAPGGPAWSLRDYLQDQRTWVERGLVDALHPQLYARDLAGYEDQLDAVLGIDWMAGSPTVVSPGALASFRDYVASEATTLGIVATNRARGLAGEVWFYGEGLVAHDGALAKALRAGPYAAPARPPWRASPDWRPGEIVAERVVEEDGGGVVFRLQPAVAGVYEVYAELASGPAALSGEALSVRALGVELALDGPGWMNLGQVRCAPLEAREVARVDAAAAARIVRVIGLIDRRASGAGSQPSGAEPRGSER